MQFSLEQALDKGVEFQKASMFAKAEEFYNKVLKLEPRNPYANHNKGILILNSGDISQRLKYLRTALESNPNEKQFWISYVDALIRVGNQVDAENTLKQAKSIGAKGDDFDNLEFRIKK